MRLWMRRTYGKVPSAVSSINLRVTTPVVILLFASLPLFVALGINLDISIGTVPILQTTSTPNLENEYPDLDGFLRDCIGVDRKILDSQKVDKLAGRWRTASEKGHLVLHAEMQLLLFYATNPQFFPTQGCIGVSKKCCWCCDFVFQYALFCLIFELLHFKYCENVNSHLSDRHLQDDSYIEEENGLPLVFSFGGAHSTEYPLWIFPNPSRHIKSMLEESAFHKVCHRFELVREELQEELLKRVRAFMPQLELSDDQDEILPRGDGEDPYLPIFGEFQTQC